MLLVLPYMHAQCGLWGGAGEAGFENWGHRTSCPHLEPFLYLMAVSSSASDQLLRSQRRWILKLIAPFNFSVMKRNSLIRCGNKSLTHPAGRRCRNVDRNVESVEALFWRIHYTTIAWLHLRSGAEYYWRQRCCFQNMPLRRPESQSRNPDGKDRGQQCLTRPEPGGRADRAGSGTAGRG